MRKHLNDAKNEGRRANGARDRPGMMDAGDCKEEIQGWLSRVRFRKALLGGVREADVWKKIAELNALYKKLLEAEHIRYDTLLKERTEGRGLPEEGGNSI